MVPMAAGHLKNTGNQREKVYQSLSVILPSVWDALLAKDGKVRRRPPD
jgi:hypothetical protein